MSQLTFLEDRPRPAGGIAVRALSLTQPWASLMALGAKRIETRSWGTDYRGPVAIHAAKTFSQSDQLLCFTEPFDDILRAAGFLSPSQLPRGAVIAAGVLVDCQQVGQGAKRPPRGSLEWAFGDFDWGRYLWYFDELKRFDEPIPARGALGLWEWRPE